MPLFLVPYKVHVQITKVATNYQFPTCSGGAVHVQCTWGPCDQWVMLNLLLTVHVQSYYSE